MHDLFSGFEFMLRGGFMMIPLLLSALFALTVIFERLHAFKKRYSTPKELVSQTIEQIRAGKIAQADKYCETLEAPVASVLCAGLEHFDNPVVEMELAMKNQAEEWIPLLEKRIEVIDTVITAAPLMGLLGTITGMMASFRVLSEKGVNEPNAITGGVAEALIATATGLVIALICLVAYNYLSARIKEFIYEIEAASSRLVEVRMAVDRSKQ
jgi:biopolymer transport protein ExbB